MVLIGVISPGIRVSEGEGTVWSLSGVCECALIMGEGAPFYIWGTPSPSLELSLKLLPQGESLEQLLHGVPQNSCSLRNPNIITLWGPQNSALADPQNNCLMGSPEQLLLGSPEQLLSWGWFHFPGGLETESGQPTTSINSSFPVISLVSVGKMLDSVSPAAA